MQYVPYLILLYAVVSVVILWAHQKTRLYPLYLLKTLWVGFSILAFGWVLAMSFGESKEYIQHPMGPMELLVGSVEETDVAGVKQKHLEGGYGGTLMEWTGTQPYWVVAFLLTAWMSWGLVRDEGRLHLVSGEGAAEAGALTDGEDSTPGPAVFGAASLSVRGAIASLLGAMVLTGLLAYATGWKDALFYAAGVIAWGLYAALATAQFRRAGHWCLLTLLLVALTPMIKPLMKFDWSRYTHAGANYTYAWNEGHIGEYFINSLIVTITTVAMTTLFGAMAAYAIARRDFRGKNLLYGAIIGSIAIPGILIQVPLFLLIKDWGFDVGGYHYSFMDSRLGLAVIYAALSLPFTIFVLAGFFRTLPGSLGEAACIDGCGRWRTFTQVYLPLAMPGIATTGIFNFLGAWNEFNLGMIFMSNPNFKTLPIGLYELQAATQYSAAWAPMFAGIVLLCLPTFLIFLVLQERIVAGLTAGGVKG